jgi:hypothetical protein
MPKKETFFIAASPVVHLETLYVTLHVGFVSAVEVGCCDFEEVIGASLFKARSRWQRLDAYSLCKASCLQAD